MYRYTLVESFLVEASASSMTTGTRYGFPTIFSRFAKPLSSARPEKRIRFPSLDSAIMALYSPLSPVSSTSECDTSVYGVLSSDTTSNLELRLSSMLTYWILLYKYILTIIFLEMVDLYGGLVLLNNLRDNLIESYLLE